MDINAAGAYRIPENYSWRDLNNELVILNLDSGEYFTFNDIGRVIWLSINDGKDVEGISKIIIEEYSVSRDEALSDIHMFISGLVSEGLLEPA
jgi:hypothetical protein